METLHALAARLDEASATLASLAHAVTASDPAHPAFGAQASGRPGEIGRALHLRWTAATDDRAREAGAAAARLAAAADALRSAADRYTAVDDTARRRLTGEA
ncbi:excreted virulence factor EspC (type VII ESX diderm) [Micromonospora kangleipakensis]|uniref:Excreted virulence factor EspC (Type VII ESX diderm) n=1 Tax=Micromonospora kangleipakensis TaxID=1077942 RepID=A0A4Q8B5J9_9ACTN|nr:type VII secretion target [Micromonospora kangleipakensis]RZU72860.1 excreted virulence factor EspC (type VII ESX diderm) [Micromonospora kangleipakensis]